MPIAKGTTFTPAPEGTHVARCIGCISLGTQDGGVYLPAFKVMLMFELPNEMIETDKGAKPMTVHKEYSLSLGKKSTLGQHLNSWRGRAFTKEELEGFEVSNVVGVPCQVTIQHKTSASGNVRADITAITGLPKGMTAPQQFHASVKYEIDQGQDETFRALPEWIQKKIKACEEWQVKPQKQETEVDQPGEEIEGDVPF